MGKARKASSNRKPPEAAGSHAVIAEWMGQHVMPGMLPVVERLDAMIRKELRGLDYAVKWSKAYYGLPGRGWVIELAPYHVSVNMVFFGGADFDPPPPLGEGSRYVKVRSVEEADTPEMRAWIRQAGKGKGWQ